MASKMIYSKNLDTTQAWKSESYLSEFQCKFIVFFFA